MKIDLWFPVLGKTLPSDHGYQLFAALSRAVPALHGAADWGLHTLRGTRVSPGMIALSNRPRLGLRLDAQMIPTVLALVGQTLDVNGHLISLGPPTIAPLESSDALSSRIVTIKPFFNTEPFHAALVRQLEGERLGITGTNVTIGSRKIVTVDGQKIVGFSVRVAGLSPEGSIRLQEAGLGGKRKLGCGVFRRSAKELSPDVVAARLA